MSALEIIDGEVEETRALARIDTGPQMLAPIVSAERALEIHRVRQEIIEKVLRPDVHYGPPYPGSKQKTMRKAGAEAILGVFGLATSFELVESVIDRTGERHGGEPVYAYTYRCKLTARDGTLITEADATCSTMESKYRYRKAERECPNCGVEGAVIKGKAEYGGGWLCFAKKGGCGAKFPDGDRRIEEQRPGRKLNPDVADAQNTVMRMAQKRALVAAVLIGTGCSDVFTEGYAPIGDDSDDGPEPRRAEPTRRPSKQERPQRKPTQQGPPPQQEPEPATDEPLEAQASRCKKMKGAAAAKIIELRDALDWNDAEVLEVLGHPSILAAPVSDITRAVEALEVELEKMASRVLGGEA